MNASLRILLLEDNPGDADLIEEMLSRADIRSELNWVKRLASGIERLKTEAFDVILLDLGLPDSQGLDTLRKLLASGTRLPVIVLTGLADEEVGTQAVKVGAQDYLIKGQIDAKVLARAIRHAVERAKLEAEREQYFKFFQTSADLMCIADPNGAFIKTNPACTETLGYSEAELVARPFVEFVHPEDRQRTREEMVRQLQLGASLNFENRYLRMDGSVCWLSWRAIYNRDEGLTYANARDITERKRSEAERENLLRCKEGVNLLQRSLLVPASQAEKLKSITDGIVRYFGADFCRIWLIRPGDLCAQGCIHAEAVAGPHACLDRERCLHLVASAGRYTHTDGQVHRRVPFGCYKIGQVASGEAPKFLTNDVEHDPHIHDHHWAHQLGLVSFAGYQLRVPAGQTIGVMALFAKHPIAAEEDSMLEGLGSTVALVVQQTAAEGALKRSEELIRNILASVDEAFVVIDRNYRILTANRAYCQQVGQALARIVGRPCYEISCQSTSPCHECDPDCACKVTFANGEPGGSVRTRTDARGKPSYFEVKTYAMKDDDGTVKSVIEIINDITEKTVLESQLRQAQKMEAIGTLAGGIAHDFNNILTAILGYGEIVMEQLPADSPLREEQAHVLKAGKRAGELVRQILTFSRRTEQQLQPLLVQFVLKEALKLLRASIPTSIEIRENVDVNCGAVLADPVQIHQVVMNLCTNAYQAMRESGGTLAVSLKGVEVAPEEAKMHLGTQPGPHVRLEVADSGCGMAREVRERIFEPYFTTKGKGEGTGLGLSLVHGIVTGLGGWINVYSEPGRGSTFKVYLPLIAGEAASPAEPAREVSPRGVESVLVVDDEEAIISLERRILEALGYRVTAFSDSSLALRAFGDQPTAFDLIITDMTMPRLNGDELAREILRLRPGMPIILCTGFSELIDADKAKGLGIREFLQKPLDNAELARAVRRALGGQESGPGA